MAVTDTSGRFKIEKVPAGEHNFTVWHERIGFVDTSRDPLGNFEWKVQKDGVNWVGRNCLVTVKANQTTDFAEIGIPEAAFQESD